MKYKVSVIIPVYNAQNTIKCCIDSVINQSIGFPNIELIIYDDNSTDDTRKILNEYSNKYDNIVLILSDTNSGYPGKGRNEGIKKSTADYIMFLDNDDRYKEDFCETLYNEVISENADFVSSPYESIDGTSSKINSYNINKGICKEDKIIFLNDSTFDFIEGVIWNKIFKKTTIILNDVKFPESSLSEDVYFIYSLLIYSNKIVYLKEYVGYEWHITNFSTSHSADYDKIKGAIDSDLKILSKYKDNKINADYSYMFSNKVSYPLTMIFTSDVLDNKKQTKNLLNYIHSYEKEFSFDDSYLSPLLRIPNKFILKKRFSLAILILKVLRFCYMNKIVRKLYRIIE